MTYKHNGWEYRATDDSDDDRQRTEHWAVFVKEDRWVLIDQSGYYGMTEEAFKAHIDLGFPPRLGSGPWLNDTIVMYKQSYDAGKENI
jgi:hypothetical protein